MNSITRVHGLALEARQRANLTQRDLAQRLGTSQSAIARLEQGATNPTVGTLVRTFAAAGFELRIELVPLSATDPVVERYKQDVDRTLLRENLGKPVDERLRTLSEWQVASRELQRAARAGRARK